MIQSYFRIAFRSLAKNRGYSLINIIGLAVGLAVAMVIALWVWDEWHYNKTSDNYEKVARVMWHSTQNGNVVTSPNMPFPLAAELRNSYPLEFEHVAVSWSTEDYNFMTGNDKFRKRGRFMEPDGAKILSLKMLSGSRSALQDPASVLISESTAKSAFGNDNPIGRTVKLDNELDAQIAGVYKDFPDNSEFRDLSFVASWQLFVSAKRRQWMKDARDNWEIKTFEILVQTSPQTTVDLASKKAKNAMSAHLEKREAGLKPAVILHPMSKWHLFSEWENGRNTGGQVTYLWIFGVTGVFILLLACINFINLSTARSGRRSLEIGIRKVVGSMRAQLILQFLIESVITVAFSFILALVLVEISLPFFNAIAGKKIVFLLGNGLAVNPYFCMAGIALCLLVALVAGTFPAFYLSSFKPVKILKPGGSGLGKFTILPRRALVVLQFTVSISLIIGSVAVFRQVRFGQTRSAGYDQSRLINVQMIPSRMSLEALKNDLLQSGAVSEVAQSSGPVTEVLSNASGFYWAGKTTGFQESFAVIATSHSYGKTVGWQIKEGRDFSMDFPSDSAGIILNESAVKYMGLKDPVSKIVRWKDGTFNDDSYHVVGVIKDMVMQSPFEPVKQTIYFMAYAPNFLYIRIRPDVEISEALTKIQTAFHKHLPETVFDFKFADEQYASKFASEERIGKLVFLFAALAIFISCLGLFGLAAFTAEQRTKEIGVRKVLGASVLNVWMLISREFMFLVVIGMMIAIPVTAYLLQSWLSKYPYHADLVWWIFALSGFGALTLTMLTISFQTIQAALSNPVKSLKSE